jgi:MFS family permease
LVAVAILLVGHGLQLSLLPMRAEALGWTAGAIGLSGSAYFLGFVAGGLLVPAIVAEVHHSRTFMVMAAAATVALLGLGLFEWVAVWIVLRFCTGFAFAGLYMVIESWLSEAAPSDRRGSVLAIYTMISLLAMMVGQSFLGLADPLDSTLVMVSAFIMGLAIIPIGLTRMAAPQQIPRIRFSPRALARASRVAVVCAFFGGLVTGAFWSMGPLVGMAFGLDGAAVGALMGVAITGGALAQVPVGRLSDRTDRRAVIAGLSSLGVVCTAVGWMFAAHSTAALFAVMLLLGATTMPVYALCIVTAADRAEVPLIQIASGILVVNSFGAIIGPMLAAPLMAAFGGEGFFLFCGCCMALGAAWAWFRVAVADRPRHHEHAFVAVPRTSIVATELAAAELSPATDEVQVFEPRVTSAGE